MFVGQTKKKVDIKNFGHTRCERKKYSGRKRVKNWSSRPLPCRRCPPGDTYGFGKKEAVSLTFLLFAISLSLSLSGPRSIRPSFPPPLPRPSFYRESALGQRLPSSHGRKNPPTRVLELLLFFSYVAEAHVRSPTANEKRRRKEGTSVRY